MNHKPLYARVGVLLCLCATIPWSGAAQLAREFRNPFAGGGARGIAMADALVAEPYDVGSLFWNPAALAFVEQSSVLVDYLRSNETQTDGYILAAPLLPSRTQTFGLGLSYYRSREPNKQQTLFPDEYGIDLASATAVTYSFSLGLRAGMRFGHSDYAQGIAGFVSLGAMYAPSPMISYAFVYNGLSLGSSYSADNDSASINTAHVQRSFEIGITMRYPSPVQARVITISLANQKVIGRDGLYYKGGIEITPVNIFSFRMGYITGPDIAGAHYGAGINTRWLQLGYAIIPRAIQSPTHRISMLIFL